MSPARRSTDAGFFVKCFRFVSAPLVDGNTGRMSITRILAFIDTAIAAHAIEAHHPISGTALWVLVMAMAAAFGKSTFGFFLTRLQMKTAVQQTDTKTDTHVTVDESIKVILDRRNADTGFEVTP